MIRFVRRVACFGSQWMGCVVAIGLVWSLSLAVANVSAAEPGLEMQPPAAGRFVKTDRGYMVPYSFTIPGSDVRIEMQPCPGGKFRLGSLESEAKRALDEGPVVEVEVAPFWIATYETTWAEYKQYMSLNDVFNKIRNQNLRTIVEGDKPWIVTAPSKLYDTGFTYRMGEEPRQPAVTMSHFAARQYTKWLSGVTGQTLRLPTEAEWEYACRAGTTTAYSFGDDPKQLGDYAWYFGNAKDKTHDVGQKKPNPWGLHDMHGNVGEWVLDEFTEAGYGWISPGPVKAADAVKWPQVVFPRVVRGGSWDEEPDRCRSAARRASHDDDWRAEDPNIPQSPWWFTSDPAQSVGFRIVRQLEPLTPEWRKRAWEADVDSIQEAADRRIDKDGRGGRGVADPKLIDLRKQLK